MGVTRAYHRPLVSGIMVITAKQVENRIQNIGGGTLTGLATRNSDGKKMLVTNLHVMSGSVQTNPSGSEEMYQMAMTDDRKVGSLPAWDPDSPAWVPIVSGQDNIADVAMCGLDEGVDAEFTMHDHPNHSSRKIIEGMEEPVDDDNNPMTAHHDGRQRRREHGYRQRGQPEQRHRWPDIHRADHSGLQPAPCFARRFRVGVPV